jgi:SAM-dependent methyltransferase
MRAPSDWWRDFFSGLTVGFWNAAVPEEATRADLGFLWEHLRLAKGSRVLDVPCGSGRLALPLAERGCAMTGIDISEEFLEIARTNAAAKSLAVDLRRAEMRQLPGRGDFDAAFCFGNSFGFLDDEGNEAFLFAVSRALRPGGRFAVDYGQSAESVFPRMSPRLEAEVAGFTFVEETAYEPLSARVENRYTISREGRTETRLASQRVYMVREVVELLAKAGLSVDRIFGSPAGDPFDLGAHRLLLVAEKKG